MDDGKPSRPRVILIAGPNGAGKSTSAPRLLKGTLGVAEFVNADTIAQGLSAFDQESASLPAGRVMLARLKELARGGASFAFETTLASRSFHPWITDLRKRGWLFHLVFLSLSDPEICLQRVADRVRLGGHHVPDGIVRRRYSAGLRNFFSLYQPIADRWRVYDNSIGSRPRILAIEKSQRISRIFRQSERDHLVRIGKS